MRDLLFRWLTTHGRRENMSINGVSHQYLRFCGCQLCQDTMKAINIDADRATDFEVEHDSDPPQPISV